MKISRNQPCPCGSGKKYKMCCGGKPHLHPQISKDYFHLKGREAEQLVQDLALKTFLIDWCYLNPRLPDGKELCDLLVMFDNIAIIWGVKDLKLDETGKYKKSEIEKNLRQISGARRQLFELKTKIELENPRRGKELFDPATISEIYLISVLMGEEQDLFRFIERVKNYTVHVFTQGFTGIILDELDTISDFCEYLHDKEDFINKQSQKISIYGGEEELLTYYLMNNRSFERLRKFTNILFLEGGSWKHFQKKPEYKAKKLQDEISYIWDNIINTIHTGGSEYEEVARELARPNRFERRMLSKAFFNAHVKAQNRTGWFSRRLPSERVTYCFAFLDDKYPMEYRKSLLRTICWIARGKFQNNRKVIGIATEKTIMPECSYDIFLIDKTNWTDEDQKEADKLQKIMPLCGPPHEFHEYEYPNSTEF